MTPKIFGICVSRLSLYAQEMTRDSFRMRVVIRIRELKISVTSRVPGWAEASDFITHVWVRNHHSAPEVTIWRASWVVSTMRRLGVGRCGSSMFPASLCAPLPPSCP